MVLVGTSTSTPTSTAVTGEKTTRSTMTTTTTTTTTGGQPNGSGSNGAESDADAAAKKTVEMEIDAVVSAEKAPDPAAPPTSSPPSSSAAVLTPLLAPPDDLVPPLDSMARAVLCLDLDLDGEDGGKDTKTTNGDGGEDNGAASPPSSSLPPVAERMDQLEIDARSHLLTLTDRLVDIVRRRHAAGSSSPGGGGGAAADGEESEEEREATQDVIRFLGSALDLCSFLVVASRVDLDDEDDGDDQQRSEGRRRHRLIASAAENVGPAASRLPFALLEDAVDTLPLSKCKILWTRFVESRSSTLTDPNLLFTPSTKLIFLRVANRLLTKKLSRERNAEFSGRVLTFVANAYPLSERSGLNVLGKFNVENVTDFERDEDKFEERLAASVKTAAAAETSSLQKNQRREVGGDESMEEGEEEVEDHEERAGRLYRKGEIVNYDLYRTFWGIQSAMSDPNSLLPPVGSVGGKGGEQKFEEFVGSVRKVLTAFECHPFPEEGLVQARERWMATKKMRPPSPTNGAKASVSDSHTKDVDVAAGAVDVAGGGNVQGGGGIGGGGGGGGRNRETARHQKYLTSGQLLRLQLRDPELRLQFLSQLLVVCHHLLRRQRRDGSDGGGGGGAKVADGKAGAGGERTAAALSDVLERTEALMKATPPNGREQHVDLVWLLESREPGWVRWKDGKCPSFERYDVPEADAELLARGRKAAAAARGRRPDASAGAAPYAQLDVTAELPGISRRLAGAVPSSLEDFLEDYVEALDPDNGIEAEYHPRTDPVFCWRALRLLSRDHLDRFGAIRVSDGDFEGVVRSIWKEEKGIVIPEPEPEPNPTPEPEREPMPDAEPEKEMAEEKEPENEKGEEKEASDADDDDLFSVGSSKPSVGDVENGADYSDNSARIKTDDEVAISEVSEGEVSAKVEENDAKMVDSLADGESAARKSTETKSEGKTIGRSEDQDVTADPRLSIAPKISKGADDQITEKTDVGDGNRTRSSSRERSSREPPRGNLGDRRRLPSHSGLDTGRAERDVGGNRRGEWRGGVGGVGGVGGGHGRDRSGTDRDAGFVAPRAGEGRGAGSGGNRVGDGKDGKDDAGSAGRSGNYRGGGQFNPRKRDWEGDGDRGRDRGTDRDRERDGGRNRDREKSRDRDRDRDRDRSRDHDTGFVRRKRGGYQGRGGHQGGRR